MKMPAIVTKRKFSKLEELNSMNKSEKMCVGKKKWFGILMLISLVFCITGCSLLSEEDEQKANQLIEEYSDEFKEQVKQQYGINADVEEIKALLNERGALSYEVTDNLSGTVKTETETFPAIYSMKENKVFPHYTKNFEKIQESVPGYFKEILGIDVCYGRIGITMYNSENEFLPEEVNTYKDLKDIREVSVVLYTTSDISQMNTDTFLDIKDKTNSGIIRIYQIEDSSKAKEISKSKEIDGVYYLRNISEEERTGIRNIGVIRAVDNRKTIKYNDPIEIVEFE